MTHSQSHKQAGPKFLSNARTVGDQANRDLTMTATGPAALLSPLAWRLLVVLFLLFHQAVFVLMILNDIVVAYVCVLNAFFLYAAVTQDTRTYGLFLDLCTGKVMGKFDFGALVLTSAMGLGPYVQRYLPHFDVKDKVMLVVAALLVGWAWLAIWVQVLGKYAGVMEAESDKGSPGSDGNVETRTKQTPVA